MSNKNLKKPNILWIMTDQQSSNMLGCAGNQYVQTPYLDELASRAVRFENAYCANPVCGPSRFSLFTGLYPGDAGIRHNCDLRQEKTPQVILDNAFGTCLREQGYTTVYGGKEHLIYVNAKDLGFEYISGDERDGLSETCAEYIRKYDWEKPLFMVASFVNPHDICLMAVADAVTENEKVNDMKRIYAREIAEVEKALEIPEGMSEEEFFDRVCPPLPENYEPAREEPEAIDILQRERIFKKLARENYSDQRWRLHRWAYAQLTKQVDGQIGKILEALKASGQWDDTVVIFTSDHGDMDASHKMEHKENLYQEACRIPLIIKGVDQGEGRVSRQLVCNGLDLFPTVADYAGARFPDHCRGKSLKNSVQDGLEEKLRDILVIECENGIGAVNEQFKYVCYDKGARKEQFYDLSVNPGEMYNQIQDEKYGHVVERFREKVQEHYRTRPSV